MNDTTNWQQVLAAFQRLWGYEAFRPPQGEVVRSLLARQDSLIVMPTGSGKSICFQLPALLQKGLTLVVSPLVALMENQVRELRQKHLPAGLLHSQLPASERQQTLHRLQQLRLLYLSPETLLSPPVWQRLCEPQLNINGLILDEAHCLVQWGETFRPAYQRLGAVRPALLQHKPAGTQMAIAAFTATADSRTREKIEALLQLQRPQLFLLSPYRANLNLQVQPIWTPKCRRQQLLKFIRASGQQSGLVYVRSRRTSETIAQLFCCRGYASAAYHAGLSPQQRRQIEASWLAGQTQFVVCTSAFGLGINKPDVRWLVQFQTPQLLAEYLQEVGRVGRDGQPAEILTLTSEPAGWLNPEDRQYRQFVANQLQQRYQQAQNLAPKIPPQGEVDRVAQEFNGGEFALAILHSAGQLDWQDPFHYQRRSGKLTHSLAQLRSIQQQWQGQMIQYLKTRGCRWQFLLNAFGFPQEAAGFRCGHCDNCRH